MPQTQTATPTPTAPATAPPLPLGLSRAARFAHDQPISGLIHIAFNTPGIISLAAGLVDYDSLPLSEVGPLTQEILGSNEAARAALQYGTTEGFDAFRETLFGHLQTLEARAGGTLPEGCSAKDIVVTTGSQQLLHTITEVLVDEGDIVVVGWPSYFVYTSALTSFGATVRSVDLDEDGMDPAKLDRLLDGLEAVGQLRKVKAVYVVDYHQNPTGITLSAERRPQLLDVVRKYSERAGQRIVLIEDAAYRELTFDGNAPRSIKSYDTDNRHVALCQTFSKPFAPGLKTGYGLLPEGLTAPVAVSKGGRDFGSSNLCHHVLHRAMVSGVFEKHAEGVRAAYAKKLAATHAALQEHLGDTPGVSWSRANGGMYVWLTLPESIDTAMGGALFNRAVEEGVLYVPGVFCYPTDPTRTPPKNTIRLAVGVPTVEQIHEGVARLARAIAAVA